MARLPKPRSLILRVVANYTSAKAFWNTVVSLKCAATRLFVLQYGLLHPYCRRRVLHNGRTARLLRSRLLPIKYKPCYSHLTPAAVSNAIVTARSCSRDRRLRCWAHIANRVAIYFSFGLNRRESSARHNTTEVDLAQAWREKGPMGRLQNLVQYASRSPQRREALAQRI